MTEHRKTKLKKIIFPLGIFLLMFITESIVGIAGVGAYFYFSGKNRIVEIETYTVNYSKTLAEAFARTSELSFASRKYTSLKTLFHEKIEENTIDEAFFVLNNGRIIVHSSTAMEKELKWNIANDEITYNTDLILLPVKRKSGDLFLNNYNIINKHVPFKRQERELLKKYIYPDISSTGWIFTKAIFHKGKPVGTVNFIISKERIYSLIESSIKQAKLYSLFVMTASLMISFFMSIVIFIRYRSIQRNTLASSGYATAYSKDIDDTQPAAAVSAVSNEDDMIFFPPDSNFIDPIMDYVIDDDMDGVVIDEDQETLPLPVLSDESRKGDVVHLRKHEISHDEDEYITVELLGEIESDNEKDNLRDTGKTREFVAPVIDLNEYKKSTTVEIRDAIPVRKKRF